MMLVVQFPLITTLVPKVMLQRSTISCQLSPFFRRHRLFMFPPPRPYSASPCFVAFVSSSRPIYFDVSIFLYSSPSRVFFSECFRRAFLKYACLKTRLDSAGTRVGQSITQDVKKPVRPTSDDYRIILLRFLLDDHRVEFPVFSRYRVVEFHSYKLYLDACLSIAMGIPAAGHASDQGLVRTHEHLHHRGPSQNT